MKEEEVEKVIEGIKAIERLLSVFKETQWNTEQERDAKAMLSLIIGARDFSAENRDEITSYVIYGDVGLVNLKSIEFNAKKMIEALGSAGNGKCNKNEAKLKNEHKRPIRICLECLGDVFLTYRKSKRSACDKRYLFLLESLLEVLMAYSDEKTAHDMIVLFRKAEREAFELSKIKDRSERKKKRIEAEDRLVRESEEIWNKIMFL